MPWALPKPHHAPRAKRVIFLFMEGGPSQLDLFDHKPGLVERFDQDLPDSVRAITTLPEKYRAPLVLRDVAGKTYEEIAGILETNEGTIKSRISRGRNLLREKLKKYF